MNGTSGARPGPHKVLATIGSGPMERVLDQALPTFAAFAERHDYDLVACRTNAHAGGRPPSWGKIRLMRSLLQRYEIVLWIDADAIILDDSSDPAELLGPEDYQALVLLHVQGRTFPTCGVWLVRSTDRTRAFLDTIWQKEGFINHHWWEQAAVVELLGYLIPPDSSSATTTWTDGTVLLDESWNQIPLTTRSLEPCRIRHYAGETNAVRYRRMRTDRHALAASTASGWQRRWHRGAACTGGLRWRLLDGPLGTYGTRYRAQVRAYEVAKTVGLVAVVRRVRRVRSRTNPQT